MSAHTTLDELPGRSVIDSTGRVIGQVACALVDLESWAVEALRTRLVPAAATDLGLASSMLKAATLDVPTGLVLAAGDAVILRATLDDLHGLVAQADAGLAQPSAATIAGASG